MKDLKPLAKKIENKTPSNLEAEQALLGSIMVNNDIIDEIIRQSFTIPHILKFTK